LDVKGEGLFQLFKSKLSNGTKTFRERKFLCIVKLKKLGFIAPFSVLIAQP